MSLMTRRWTLRHSLNRDEASEVYGAIKAKIVLVMFLMLRCIHTFSRRTHAPAQKKTIAAQLCNSHFLSLAIPFMEQRGVVPFFRPYPLSHTRVDTAGSVVNTLRT